MPLVTKEKKIAPARKRKQLPSRAASVQGEFAAFAQNWRLSALPRLSQPINRPQTQRVRLINWGSAIWQRRCGKAAFLIQ
jgi:hypothetical protein